MVEPRETSPKGVEDTGKRCAKCGYDLRGFADHSCCPKCATFFEKYGAFLESVGGRIERKSRESRYLAEGRTIIVWSCHIGGWLLTIFISVIIVLPDQGEAIIGFPTSHGLASLVFLCIQIPITIIGFLYGVGGDTVNRLRATGMIGILFSFAISAFVVTSWSGWR